MGEIKRLLSWVGFLEPLSEEELDDLVRRARYFRLGAGRNSSSAPRGRASGC
jgi:hypothetical protein